VNSCVSHVGQLSFNGAGYTADKKMLGRSDGYKISEKNCVNRVESEEWGRE
jgi:hypothetical protein